MKQVKIQYDFIDRLLWVYDEEGAVTNDIPLISENEKIKALIEKITDRYGLYYDFDAYGEACSFNYAQRILDKKKLLSWFKQLIKELERVNDNSFYVVDYETPMLKSLPKGWLKDNSPKLLDPCSDNNKLVDFKGVSLFFPTLQKVKVIEDTDYFANFDLPSEYEHFNYNNLNFVLEAQSDCVRAHIMRYWNPNFKWIKREILIKCFGRNDKVAPRSAEDIYFTCCRFDYREFFNSDNSNKKKIIFNIYKKSIIKVLKKNKLDTVSFKEACNKVQQDSYINELCLASKTNSGGSTAEVVALHDIFSLTLYFVVKDKNGDVLFKQDFINLPPFEKRLRNLAGEIGWIDKDKISYATTEHINYILNLKEKSIKKIYGEELNFKEREEWNNTIKKEETSNKLQLSIIERSPK